MNSSGKWEDCKMNRAVLLNANCAISKSKTNFLLTPKASSYVRRAIEMVEISRKIEARQLKRFSYQTMLACRFINEIEPPKRRRPKTRWRHDKISDVVGLMRKMGG